MASVSTNPIGMILAFHAEYGEFPKLGGLRLNETSLARWVSARRREKREGHNPDVCAIIEKEIPFWVWDPTQEPVEYASDARAAFEIKRTEFQKELARFEAERALLADEKALFQEGQNLIIARGKLMDERAAFEKRRSVFDA